MRTQDSYQLRAIAATVACLLVGLVIAVNSNAQSPFNGIAIQEVLIEATSLVEIDADLDAGNGGPASARCWRVYVCLDDPDWELQAFWGDNFNQWHLETSTEFWQSDFNGFLAKGINPALFAFVPSLQYDSWFTIGLDNALSNTAYLNGSTNPLLDDFENNGTGFLVNDALGSSIFGTWLPPNSEGRSDVENKLLIAQFTTDGTFWGTMNFQFRKLNSDGSVYLDPVLGVIDVHATGVFINGLSPGAAPDLCPTIFLPVELLYFEAEPINQQVALNWSTASEVNNDYFTVERSADKENWEEVVQMDGHGSTNLENHYSTLDTSPLLGTSYYRLKQTDTNGDITLSQVVPVTFLGEEIEVFPNPTRDSFFVKGDLSSVNTIQVIDSRGRIVSFDQQTNLNREWKLGQLGLDRGVYFVEFILDSGVTLTKKLILH